MSRADNSVLAIDPGPTHSGVVLLARVPSAVGGFEIAFLDAEMENHKVRGTLSSWSQGDQLGRDIPQAGSQRVAIETIMPYGARVGMETFETCFFIGELKLLTWQRIGANARLINRHQVKSHICQTTKATDADLADALRVKFGVSKKEAGKKGSPLFGVKSHSWAALALAVTFMETDDPSSLTTVGQRPPNSDG